MRQKMNSCAVSQESSWKCHWSAIVQLSFCWPPYTKALPWDCLSACDIAFFFLHNSTVLLITECWSQSFSNFIVTVYSTFLWISMEFHRQLSYSWACVFMLQLNMMVSFLLLSNQHYIIWNPYLPFFLTVTLTVKILKNNKSNFCSTIKGIMKCILKDKKGSDY